MILEAGIIAVIEDPFIRKLVRDILKPHGYVVREAPVENALRMLGEGPEHVNLLITNRPAEFLAWCEVLPLLYLAAAPEPELAARFKRCLMLRKPFHPDELVAAVARLSEPPA